MLSQPCTIAMQRKPSRMRQATLHYTQTTVHLRTGNQPLRSSKMAQQENGSQVRTLHAVPDLQVVESQLRDVAMR